MIKRKRTFGWYIKRMYMDIVVSLACLFVLCISIGLIYVPSVYGVGVVMLCYAVPMFIWSCVKVYNVYRRLRGCYGGCR